MAILTEHLAGKWPLWLSPRQIVVCSISEKYLEYARKVYEELKKQGFEVEIDDSDASISKKVRNGQLAQFNYILILGDQEESTKTVEIRSREGGEKMVNLLFFNKCRVKCQSKTSQKISNLSTQQEFRYLKDLLMKSDINLTIKHKLIIQSLISDSLIEKESFFYLRSCISVGYILQPEVTNLSLVFSSVYIGITVTYS